MHFASSMRIHEMACLMPYGITHQVCKLLVIITYLALPRKSPCFLHGIFSKFGDSHVNFRYNPNATIKGRMSGTSEYISLIGDERRLGVTSQVSKEEIKWLTLLVMTASAAELAPASAQTMPSAKVLTSTLSMPMPVSIVAHALMSARAVLFPRRNSSNKPFVSKSADIHLNILA